MNAGPRSWRSRCRMPDEQGRHRVALTLPICVLPSPPTGQRLRGCRTGPTPAPQPCAAARSVVPSVPIERHRLENGLRVILSRDDRAPGRRRQPVVRRREQARVARQDRLRPPLRAHDVPGIGARRQDGALLLRPGRRRHAERHDLARPHELLRDAAQPRAGAGALARGGPHGKPPAGHDPGEARQPARRGRRTSAASPSTTSRTATGTRRPRSCSSPSGTHTTTRPSAPWRT